MTAPGRIAPLAFHPDYEVPEPDEAETFAELRQSLRHIVEVTSKDYGHAVRAVHAKSHGLLEGKVEVLPDLPGYLAQGAFAKPGSYAAVLRFSTNPGDILTMTSRPRAASPSRSSGSRARVCRVPRGRTPRTSSCRTPAPSPHRHRRNSSPA